MHLRSGSYAGALENLDIDVVNFGRVYKNWNVRSARADCLVEGFEGILPTLEGGDTCELECNGNGVALFDSYYGTISAKTRRPRGCVAARECGRRRRLAASPICVYALHMRRSLPPLVPALLSYPDPDSHMLS